MVRSVPTLGMTADFYKRFGQNLRLARRKAGLSQADLAIAIELTRTSVSNIEKGRQKILLHTFDKMLRVLNVQPGKLLAAAHVKSASPPVLTSLTQQDRDFVERGLNQLRKEKHGSSFDENPEDDQGLADGVWNSRASRPGSKASPR